MSSRTRLANKTIWALEDLAALCGEARSAWARAMDRAERSMDPVLVLALARLRDCLGQMEGIAREARMGRYEEGRRG